MSHPVFSAPLLGGRVLELTSEGRHWRVSVTQIDGKNRRQVGGSDLAPDEWPGFLVTLRAMGAYVDDATHRRAA